MTALETVPLGAVELAVLAVALLALLSFALGTTLYRRQGLMAARIARARGEGPGASGARGRGLAKALLAGLGGLVAANPVLLGKKEMDALRRRLVAAGFYRPGALPYAIAAKLLLATLFGLWGWLVQGSHPHWPLGVAALLVLGGALLGWRLPDIVLNARAGERRKAVERGLPDALDLLVICGEAGLGLDTAIGRVAEEMAQAHPVLGEELAITAAEMRVLPDRHAALANLADRLGLEVLRSTVATLAQTLRFGTPLGQALRVLAGELRRERIVKFEEQAAKLPVKLTLPMVVFILPCVFIVVGGPAVLDLAKLLSSM